MTLHKGMTGLLIRLEVQLFPKFNFVDKEQTSDLCKCSRSKEGVRNLIIGGF